MNTPTIIVLSIIGVIVVAIIVKSIINRKNGKSGCSCGCSSCGNKEFCHPSKKKDKE
ncbi:MAG: FeoB-associated Cys-rich membrane protein [Clostridia bacterium]|nr:FeoB-associated Cys-rich membrane protein [Clostridia bacterium]